MNIEDSSAIRQCTGCQVCAAICPADAISINLNTHGFYCPTVDSTKCIDCSMCVKVCYKFLSIDETSNNTIHDSVFAASSNDDSVVRSTTSGGIAKLLCDSLIDKGYKCVGVKYDSVNDIAVGEIAETKVKAQSFQGSKYIQSYSFAVFKEILKNHLNEKIAIFGTPCQIFAIDRYLAFKKKRENFVLIDFFCHGCPSMLVWEKYLKEIKESRKIPIDAQILFRSKIEGWHKYIVEIKDNNKTYFVSDKKKNEFYELFFSDLILNDSCSDCKLRSTLQYSDIRVGDFWGDKYDSNKRGVSLVIPVTKNGFSCFEGIKSSIKSEKCTVSDAFAAQSYGITYSVNSAVREKMFSVLVDKDMSLKKVLKVFHENQPILRKLIRLVKGLLPEEMYLNIKSFLKKTV